MGVRGVLGVVLMAICAGCAVVQTPPVMRVALLAPFEGRYREIGYDMLYAARLALADTPNIELLPMDDGGTVGEAAARAEALALNPSVRVALVAGYAATHEDVQAAFGDVPVMIVGHWSAHPQDDDIFMLASAALDEFITTPESIGVIEAAAYPAPLVGGDVFALEQFPRLRDDLSGITVVSSAALPDEDFTARYLASGAFVDAPGLLATITYDAASIAAQALISAPSREGVTQTLNTTSYEGVNGIIRFSEGYWHDAPIISYEYNADGVLSPR